MQQVKKSGDYTIFRKKSGRYAVMGKKKQLLHGNDKAQVLLAEALIEPPKQKTPASEAAPESAEESSAS